ncbi:hypothetical protein [Aquirufa rosea]|uniref:ABC transporter ATPase n=1 Tax=Aquirufa rosea TaxID=2509241 RepID=A0A4Q1C1A1_9BACT|nr:hypothetical protein [Aquirufa rosea]RXK50925.1 hypothetical protein ESB04_04535 [Aquirufa rosea]
MYVALPELPNHSRVWIYQASRAMNEEELDFVQMYLKQAVQDWNAHGVSLLASFEIKYKQIIMIAVDEQLHAASGCSIDASTTWFKDLAVRLGIDFFDRSVALAEGDHLRLLPLLGVKQAVAEGTIHPDSSIAVPQVKDLGEYRSNWPISAKNSWLSKYFVATTI